jgi:hypothetical protein
MIDEAIFCPSRKFHTHTGNTSKVFGNGGRR